MSSPAERFLDALATELRAASNHRINMAHRESTDRALAFETAALVLADIATAVMRAAEVLRE